jgi:energy-coupling factor transport system ATP-binding protein
MEPDVLVLDEPAAGLDPIGRTEIFGGIRRYQRTKGNTVIIVSHSMEDVAEYCDNLTVLKNGQVLLYGRCAEVFRHEKELTESGLGVPQIARFMRLLRERGVELSEDIYTVSAAFDELKRILRERQGDDNA